MKTAQIPQPLQYRIDILIFIDVSKALSEKTLKGYTFMMDNSPFRSQGQASFQLQTRCVPQQLLSWKVIGLDVQTPATICDISFFQPDGTPASKPSTPEIPDFRPEQNAWTGTVPPYMALNQPYRYKIDFQMGRGDNSILSLESPSIIRVQ